MGGRTRKAFLAHLLPDSAAMCQETKTERDSTGCFSHHLRCRVHIHGDSCSGGIGGAGRVCGDMAGDGVTLAPECLTAALRILSSSSGIRAEKAQCDQTE